MFTHIINLQSTVFILRNVVYSLHYALHEKAIIDWGYLISNEFFFQLNNLKKNRKLYMNSYLIFAIAYGNVFEDLSREKHVDFKLETIYAWYLVPYRHKAQYNFYSIHNNSISEFKKLIFDNNTSRVSLEGTSFLFGKGSYEISKEFIVSILFGNKDNPFLLPLYVSDKLFVREMCKQYKTWAHF